MIKITSPANLTPFDGKVVFRFTSDAATGDASETVDVAICDADTDTLLAGRRIHLDSTGTAQLDVAPILRRAFMLHPAGGPSGLFAATDCRFRIRVSAGSVQSAIVTLPCAAPQNRLALITSMPRRRTLRYGETERLLFFAPEAFSLNVEVQSGSGTTTSRMYSWNGAAGMVALRLRTTDFDPEARRITVRNGGTTVAEYEVGTPIADSVRLAWRSAAGSTEHYTFPVTARRTLAAGRQSVRLAGGVCTVAVAAHTEVQLRSHYENSATIEALAAIAASPQVWVADDETGEYTAVEVLTQEVATPEFGEPASVVLTVRPSQNGTRI